jgi:hypothetical protein
MGVMIVPERVAQFLQKNKPAAYCYGCIASGVKLQRQQQAQQAAAGLGAGSGFTRTKGKCAACGKMNRQVTRAN